MTKLKIVYMKLDDIEGAEVNPKKHHGDLGSSIDRFGFADAPIRDGRTGRLVAGHGRIAQLKAMAARGEDPPGGVAIMKGAWSIPVQTGWSSSSDAEAAAFLIAHNRLTTAGGWDDTALGKLLAEIEGEEGGAMGLGFSDVELELILQAESAAAAEVFPEFPEIDEDLSGIEQPKTVKCPACEHEFEA